MKLKQLIFIFFFLMLPIATFAETVKVNVNGMVCSFCAQGIKKKFESKDSVKNIEVNLDEKLVTINFIDGKTLSDDEIKEIITKAGYEVKGVTRS